MENLARRSDCDKAIRDELEVCDIPVIELPVRLNADVPATLIGRLGPFSFFRYWSHWVVNGPMPLEIARELNKYAGTSIRVAGIAGGDSPDTWAKWRLDDGRIILPSAREAHLEKHIAARFLDQSEQNKYAFSDDPASIGAKAFVDVYHIDSLRGLKLFADTVRKHGLI